MTYADGFNIRDKDAVSLTQVGDALDGLLAATTWLSNDTGQTTNLKTTYTAMTGVSQAVAVATGETVIIVLSFLLSVSTSGDAAQYRILRDATAINTQYVTARTNNETFMITMIARDQPAAGTYTYTSEITNTTNTNNVTTDNRRMITLKVQET